MWSAKLGPTLTKPSFKLKAGTALGQRRRERLVEADGIQLDGRQLSASAQDRYGGLEGHRVASATARQTTAWVKIGSRSRFRVMGKDARGRVGPWVYSARRKASLRGPVGVTLSGTGIDPASDPIKVKTRFDGRSVALMSKTGPGMGTARVFINGKRVATLDLERTKTTSRKLVWARNFAQAKPRAVAVKALDPAAQVDFEGFFILR